MMRVLAFTLILFVQNAFGQEPAKSTPPPPPGALSAAELEIVTDSITQLEKAQQDKQTAALFSEAATAKQERAAILFEARKLKILMDRGLTDKTHEVVYLTDAEGKNGQWSVREKLKEKPKP